MNINRDNYEIYFIDYLDGSLSPEQIAELMVFLSVNPDLEEELMGLKDTEVKLNDDAPSFDIKDQLKKTDKDLMITKENFDELCVAKLEGDLDKKQSDTLQKYLDQNISKKKEYQTFEKTRLQPDLSIEFQHKSSLKRKYVGKAPSRSWIYSAASAAAVVAIFIIFFGLSGNDRYDFLKSENNSASFINTKNVNTAGFSAFSVIGTETPSILAKSTHESAQTTKDPIKYQYVDPGKATFIKDLVHQLRTINTGNDDVFVASNFFNSASSNNSTENTEEEIIILEEDQELYAVSPKNIVLITGEVNSTEFLSDVLDDMSERYDETIEEPERRITFWDIAETGVKGYSQLTGKKINFNKETNESGKVTSLAINSNKFEFSRKKN